MIVLSWQQQMPVKRAFSGPDTFFVSAVFLRSHFLDLYFFVIFGSGDDGFVCQAIPICFCFCGRGWVDSGSFEY